MHETRRWNVNIVGMVLALSLVPVAAQVAIYEMEFEREDRSINFSFFDGGFFVMDGLTGAGSFVFTFQEVENNRLKDLYITSENSAETFTAIKKGTRKAVVRATAQTTTGLSHYLAIGELEESLPVQLRGQELRFEVATTLRGYVLASDDESDVDFTDETETLGFAGLASMKMNLDRIRSLDANRLNQTTTETVAALVAELEDFGFEAEGAGDGDGSGDGDSDGENPTDPSDPTAPDVPPTQPLESSP